MYKKVRKIWCASWNIFCIDESTYLECGIENLMNFLRSIDYFQLR